MTDELQFKSALAKYFVQHMEERKSSLCDSSYTRNVFQLHDFDNYLYSISFQVGDRIDETLVTKWTHLHDNMAANTIMTYVNSVRMFLRFYSKISGDIVYMPPSYPTNDTYVPYLFSDDEMNKPAGDLSIGKRRIIEIIKALFVPADFVVLDDPFREMEDSDKNRALDYVTDKLGTRPLLIAQREEPASGMFRIIRM